MNIACGIRDKSVQCSLLKETKLTYETALDTTLAAESAKRDARKLQEGTTVEGTSQSDVHRVDKLCSKSLPEGSKTVCYRCGENTTHHTAGLKKPSVIIVGREGILLLFTICCQKSRQKQGDKSKAQTSHVDGGECFKSLPLLLAHYGHC